LLPKFSSISSASLSVLKSHCRLHHHVTPKLPPLPLTPRRHHRHPHCQAAAATTKLLPLPLSTLQDMFDNEKEFCKMTDIDFF
jgi:hypothetical protein